MFLLILWQNNIWFAFFVKLKKSLWMWRRRWELFFVYFLIEWKTWNAEFIWISINIWMSRAARIEFFRTDSGKTFAWSTIHTLLWTSQMDTVVYKLTMTIRQYLENYRLSTRINWRIPEIQNKKAIKTIRKS